MAENNDSLSGTPTQINCAKGCGFFGSASTMNMCSKCFREHQKSSGDVAAAAPRTPAPTLPSGAAAAAGAAVAAAVAAADPLPEVALSPAVSPLVAPAAAASPVVMPTPFRPPPEDDKDVRMTDADARPPKPPTGAQIDPAAAAAASAAGPSDPAPPARRVQKNTSRCWGCRKKVGYTGFRCRCGYVYCSEHRHSDEHECDYDYQAQQREQLEKANPIVVAAKMDKI